MSRRLETLMSGWGKNRTTKPLRNTLANRTASLLNANQIRQILTYNPVLLPNVRRAIEHRAGNLRSLDMFMRNYYRKREYNNRNIKRRRNNKNK